MSIFHYLIILLSFAFARPSQTTEKLGPVQVGSTFPSFGGWTIDEQFWSSRSLFKEQNNKKHIVSYFASTCQPCAIYLPIMSTLAQEKNLNLVLIAVETDPNNVKRFIKKYKLKGTTVMDKFTKIAERHGVSQNGKNISIPKTFLLDSDGVVRVIYTEEGDDFRSHLLNEISKLK